MRRVLHGSAWRLVLFNTFIRGVEKVTQLTLIRFADDSKPGDADNNIQGHHFEGRRQARETGHQKRTSPEKEL